MNEKLFNILYATLSDTSQVEIKDLINSMPERIKTIKELVRYLLIVI